MVENIQLEVPGQVGNHQEQSGQLKAFDFPHSFRNSQEIIASIDIQTITSQNMRSKSRENNIIGHSKKNILMDTCPGTTTLGSPK